MIGAEDELFIEDVLGGRLSRQAYCDLIEAAAVAAERDALASMLKGFDAFCASCSASYFLFSETLQGVLAYEDFVPGSAKLRVGMLFDEAEKIRAAAQDAGTFSSESEVEWRLVFSRGGRTLRFPRVEAKKNVPVRYKGDDVFDGESLPVEVPKPYFEISVFNAVPDDFLTRRSFFRRMNRRNRALDKALSAHAAISARRGALFGKNGLYAMIPRKIVAGMLQRCARKYEGCGMENAACLFGTRSKTVSREVLENVERARFHGVETWVPSGQTPWASAPIDEAPRSLKKLQRHTLEILQEIDRVCAELGIGYFVCGGTMLGYMRHGGFIPWDDDIDIGMLRQDYEKFKRMAAGVVDSDRFFVQTRESDPNIPYLFSKVRMNGTTYITEYNQYRDFHKGICVDVFPFDAVPNGRGKQKAFKDEARKAEVAHNRIVNKQHPKVLLERQEGAHGFDVAIAHAVGRIQARRFWAKPLSDTQAAYDKVVRRFEGCEGLDYVASFVPSYTMIRISDLLPYRRVLFEGVEVSVPSRPDVFLKMQYGDYAELPPRHQRSGHGLLECVLPED